MNAFQQATPLEVFKQLSREQQEILRYSGGDLTSLRTYSSLRQDVWERIDDRVLRNARQRLRAVADLETAGLTQPLGNLGTQVSKWERAGDFELASQVMRPRSQGPWQGVEYDSQLVPVPVTFSMFEIDMRDQLASEARPETLEMTGVDRATRAVAEKLEDTLVNGGDVNLRINGSTTAGIPGYTDFTDRSTGTLGAAWTDTSNASWDIIGDVADMLQDAYDNNMFGDFILYVPKNYWAIIQDDYKAESDDTFIERIRRFEDISDVRAADRLANDNVVLSQMTSDNVDWGTVEPIQAVELESSMWAVTMMVFAAAVPRIKSTTSNQSGIVHYTS